MGKIQNGEEQITTEYIGEMGVKKIYIGDKLVQERTSSFLYLELITKESE